MKVTNVSGQTRTVAATGQTAEPDQTIEVSADLGKSLCRQKTVWQQAKKSRKEND